VIFGLGFSTLLTLILIPTLLAMPSVWAERWRNWRERRRGGPIRQDVAVTPPPARPALPEAAE
jgi:multidrug efflux pump